MEWIKIALPLFGVLLGWVLSENGKILSDKRQDKRKLKKLLYYLLELRYHFTSELSVELEIQKNLNALEKKIKDKYGVVISKSQLDEINKILNPMLKGILSSKLQEQESKFLYLENNIEDILKELSEMLPIFAYELSGQHKIKDRLNKFDDYLNSFQNYGDQLNFDMKGWLKPKLTENLLNDLDENIILISKKISRRTNSQAKEKIKKLKPSDDTNEDVLLDEYLSKIEESNKNIFSGLIQQKRNVT